MAHDSLGMRMKEQYEQRFRVLLPRRTWTIVRLDGRAFHTYTRGLERPFDAQFAHDMVTTAMYLLQNIQGCRLAYTHSDEISLVLTDFENPATQAWFDGNLQKIVSISASMATAKFNQMRRDHGLAVFDARAFIIPDPIEVENYLIWRQSDSVRNSVQMVGQAYFSHKELQNKGGNQIQEMLWAERNVNWNDTPEIFKRGTTCYWEDEPLEGGPTGSTRKMWLIQVPPTFTQDRDWFARVLGTH